MQIEYLTGARREVPDAIGRELIARKLAHSVSDGNADVAAAPVRKRRAYKRRDLQAETA